MEITVCEMKRKDVVNVKDGRKLGKIIDMVISCEHGKIKGLIVPGEKGFNFFKNYDDIFIPWHKICKIGDDVILVELPIGECAEKSEEKKDSKC